MKYKITKKYSNIQHENLKEIVLHTYSFLMTQQNIKYDGKKDIIFYLIILRTNVFTNNFTNI